MIHLRNINAASSLPTQPRPLRDPLLDPLTAAYLEPAALPVTLSKPAARRLPALRVDPGGLFTARKDRPYPHLLSGLLFLLVILLYLLVYAQEARGSSSPYLVVPPADARSEYLLVLPAEQAEPSLAMPVTGR